MWGGNARINKKQQLRFQKQWKTTTTTKQEDLAMDPKDQRGRDMAFLLPVFKTTSAWSSQSFSGIYRSQTKWRLDVAVDM